MDKARASEEGNQLSIQTHAGAGKPADKNRGPSLTEKRMARTRRQLAEAAAHLFLKRGYEAVTVEEIAAEVEVSPRTFFRYFASKEDVLDGRPADEPILDALRAAAYSWVSAAQRDPRTLRLFPLVMRTPLLRSRWLVRERDCQEALAEILMDRLPDGPPPHILLLASGAIIAIVATLFEFCVEHMDETEVLESIDEAIEAFADGFGLAGSVAKPTPGWRAEPSPIEEPGPEPAPEGRVTVTSELNLGA